MAERWILAVILSLLAVITKCWSFTAQTTPSPSWSTSFAIESGSFHYKDHPIAFERTTGSSLTKTETPLLLLNGFGMGSFHQHRLMRALHEQGCDRTVYGMDYLGQGKSWPVDCDDGKSASEQGLRYCGATWVDQICRFIDENVEGGKVHLVGNSVGGHLACFVAASRPDLVESVCLLNATPVWGLNLPGWSGHLPAPLVPKQIGRFLFDRMRDQATIQEFLSTTYVNTEAFDDELVQQVRGCTDGSGGHAAFASILWSPPVSVELPSGASAGFYECMEAIQSDVLLCFGQDDPWCKPAFAKRMLRSLSTRKGTVAQRYIALSKVGHCPNHEAPTATAKILSKWLSASGDRNYASLLSEKHVTVHEVWGKTLLQELSEDEIAISLVDRFAVAFI